MPNPRRVLLAGGLGLVACLITACGGGAGLLSSDQANTLNDQLGRISSAFSSGNCAQVRNATRGLADAVATLPSNVNSTLRQDLDASANQVVQLAVSQCRPQPSSQTTTPTTSTPTTSTATTPATTTPTQPTHTATTPTPTTPATTPTTPGSNSGPSGGGGLPGTGGSGTPGGTSGGSGVGGNSNGNGNGSNG